MFKNRIRLPITIGKTQFPIEKNIFRKADGTSKVLSVVIRKRVEGTTEYMPEDIHRKLVIALAHDDVTIEDTRLLTGVVLDGDYNIEWQDFLNYPVAQAKFTMAVTPFDATNSNCQTCEEITQLTVVDDDIPEEWLEGTTHTWENVLTNDDICCYPYEVDLVSFNSFYFASVTLTEAGVLTAELNPIVPAGVNVLIGTYRVTCPNGSYDEANIYVDVITGTGVECEAVTDLIISGETSTSLTASWTSAVGYYYYTIAASHSPYIVLQDAYQSFEAITFDNLEPNTEYIITVQAVCSVYEMSDVVSELGTTTVADDHLDTANYEWYGSSGITGVCDLTYTNINRTAQAAADSAAAGERVEVVVEFSHDGGASTQTNTYTFEIGATVANEHTAVNMAPFCSQIFATIISVTVIP